MTDKAKREAVGKPQRSAGRFLASASIKALLDKTYTPNSIEGEAND